MILLSLRFSHNIATPASWPLRCFADYQLRCHYITIDIAITPLADTMSLATLYCMIAIADIAS